MPALLKSTSSRPYVSTAAAIRFRTSSSFETSARMNVAAPPSASISRATAAPLSSCQSDTTTLAPSRANSSALARPMPEPPPVTIAVLPGSLPVCARTASASCNTIVPLREMAHAGFRAGCLLL